MARYVIEGEWTGYTSSQRKVAHREVVSDVQVGKGYIEKLKALHAIVYTDGTSLLLSVRQCEPRERIDQVLGYKSLIRDAVRHGGSRVLVADLKQ